MKGITCLILLVIGSLVKSEQWWEHTIVYQIYPRSFQDSDGDGTGDIKGIESRLNHLKDIGAETIWISPMYKSPMVDFGYDISDFVDIDPIFGTMLDFQDLVQAAHEMDIKIVMDFVPNHSSDQHEWFKKSVAKEDPFTDYYIWRDPSGYDENGNPLPPNNWVRTAQCGKMRIFPLLRFYVKSILENLDTLKLLFLPF